MPELATHHLRTVQHYYNAPAGTLVSDARGRTWQRADGSEWVCVGGDVRGLYRVSSEMAAQGRRRVERWGWPAAARTGELVA